MNLELRTYIALTLDPVHIGTGGYRLGRVDNSIVREPGTNLPKIPGTSLSGVVRAYAAYRANRPDCAGQGQPVGGKEGHCAEEKGPCPICYTFGHTRGERSYSGVVNFFDAEILLFPVASMYGPVWVTTREILNERNLRFADESPDNEEVLTTLSLNNQPLDGKPINLGWLLLRVKKTINEPSYSAPKAQPHWCPEPLGIKEGWNSSALEAIRKRLVIVSPNLYSQIVNSNLEVRTSVSIDPETGAAQSGALFTYEALPRTTVLALDVLYDDYRKDGFKPYINQNINWQNPLAVVKDGLRLIECLGIGGMGTRGFGRIKILNLDAEKREE
jgi:CRISPR-associated protein Cmr4